MDMLGPGVKYHCDVFCSFAASRCSFVLTKHRAAALHTALQLAPALTVLRARPAVNSC